MSNPRIALKSTRLNCFDITTKQQPIFVANKKLQIEPSILKARVDKADDALYDVDVDPCTCKHS